MADGGKVLCLQSEVAMKMATTVVISYPFLTTALEEGMVGSLISEMQFMDTHIYK